MNNVGSSLVSSLGQAFSVTGPTGATGIVGATGSTGFGITGNTGANVVGITLINRYILTTFSDGSTYQTPTQVYGNTGPTEYVIAIENLGTGLSLASSLNKINFSGYDQQQIVFRGITFINNSDGALSVNETTVNNSSYYTINLQSQQGLTVAASSATEYNLLRFNNFGAVERVSDAYGVTLNNNPNPNLIGVKFINANIFEKVRGFGWTGSTGAVFCETTNDGITCIVNPFATETDRLMFGSEPKIFVADFKNNKTSITIQNPPVDDNVYGFDLFIRAALNPTNLNNRFKVVGGGTISWPQATPPCFSVDGVTCGMKISFFGINGSWYATAVSTDTKCINDLYKINCSNIEIPYFGTASLTSSVGIGACCNSDNTCTETTYQNCFGFFHGIGTTCGTTLNSICSIPGVCCRQTAINGIKNISAISDQLTCYECLNFTDQNTKFAGNYTTLKTTNCENIFNKIGACCNGRGGCSLLTREECDLAGGFYQGDDIDCVDLFGNAVCSSGTGPCCINGTCSEQNYLTCFNNNGFFIGSGQTCSSYVCPSTTTCIGYLNGIPIYEGSKYAGGIVVGSFNPGDSIILGAKPLFDPIGVSLGNTTTFSSEFYNTSLDYYAYGVTSECGLENNSYIIIVYPYDIALDELNTLKNPETKKFIKQEFIWGGTGSSWGPLTNESYNYNDLQFLDKDYRQTHLRYSEGYWSTGVTGTTQATNYQLLSNSFSTCARSTIYGNGSVEKQFAKSPYNIHGFWFKSWGLMNTIRSIAAYNYFTLNNNIQSLGLYNSADFVGLTATNAFLATRYLTDGITSELQGITTNPEYISQWYLPSHDELAFIAAKTTNTFGFNINQILINEGQPINGVYWTSTGTFDYTKNEGIYDGSNKPNPGSLALAMMIDINGDLNNYKVFKSSRQSLYKVRPIRMLRCDNIIPNNKLWKISKVVNNTTN